MKDIKVLVAEDDGVSRKVLERYLTKWGFSVTCTADGDAAWAELSSGVYHIAVLDWNMPGLSGIQLCEKIRDDEALSLLYIILLTGRTEKKDMVMGLEAGADDYVVKPFDPLELSSRLKVGCRLVESGLLLQKKNVELNHYAKEMESLAEERSKMLIHADRLASLGTLTAGVAHEINNPNTFISGNAQTLQRCWPIIEKILNDAHEQDPGNRKLGMVIDEVPKMLDGIRNGVVRITAIVKGLKSFARVGKNTTETFAINKCLEDALLLCGNRLKYHVDVHKELSDDLPKCQGDPQKLEQVFVNLFTNAADAVEEKLGKGKGILKVMTQENEMGVLITVEDNGPGIPQAKLEDIWKPFFTTKKVGKGTGLGLAISQGIIADHGGTIQVTNLPDAGAQFKISLPAAT